MAAGKPFLFRSSAHLTNHYNSHLYHPSNHSRIFLPYNSLLFPSFFSVFFFVEKFRRRCRSSINGPNKNKEGICSTNLIYVLEWFSFILMENQIFSLAIQMQDYKNTLKCLNKVEKDLTVTWKHYHHNRERSILTRIHFIFLGSIFKSLLVIFRV